MDGQSNEEPSEIEYSSEQIAANQVHSNNTVEINIPVIGRKFNSEDEAYDFYNDYARFVGFSVRRYHKYKHRKTQMIVWREFCCSCQGEREQHPNGTPIKPRPITRFNCLAEMKIEFEKSSGSYVITKFIENHTHELAHPDRARFLKSHRVVRPAQETLINNMTDAGIGSSDIYYYFCKEAGGFEKLNFTQSDCDNIVQKRRKEFIKQGDGQLLLEYFKRKKEENDSFYYTIQLGKNNQIRNVFWCDAKSRMDYECFGDVVSFDTTYKTNEYDLPFAPFVGVNNHGQTIIFASALISDETTETFVWLFETFLKVMGGKEMKTIFTDQAMAIGNAIKEVLPNTHHRLCIWHIYQNALRNLSHIFTAYDSFGSDFKKCIYDPETEEEFFTSWEALLKNYKLEEDKWLSGIFELREKWAQVYARDHFCAGMASTQRSESINNYFKKYFKRKQLLLQFMAQHDKAVSLRRQKEAAADSKSKSSSPNLISKWSLEHCAVKFYTRKIFNRFQAELGELLNLDANAKTGCISETSVTYIVSSYCGDRDRTVEFVPFDNTAKCSCKKFEFTGILCAHILRVLRKENVLDLPAQFLLTRWSKNATPDVIVDARGNILVVDVNVPLSEIYSELSNMAQTVATRGCRSKVLTDIARSGLKRVIDELQACEESVEEVIVATNVTTSSTVPSPFVEEIDIDLLGENITVNAPPRKKFNGESARRHLGFYDKMKRKGKTQPPKKTRGQPKTAITAVVDSNSRGAHPIVTSCMETTEADNNDPKKKRGRPKKGLKEVNLAANVEESQPIMSLPDELDVGETPTAPRKRGRPTAATDVYIPSPTPTAPRKRSRPTAATDVYVRPPTPTAPRKRSQSLAATDVYVRPPTPTAPRKRSQPTAATDVYVRPPTPTAPRKQGRHTVESDVYIPPPMDSRNRRTVRGPKMKSMSDIINKT